MQMTILRLHDGHAVAPDLTKIHINTFPNAVKYPKVTKCILSCVLNMAKIKS